MSNEIRFRAAAAHLVETVKGEAVRVGSVFHDSLAEFSGLVTRSHPDGTHDIVIFPPDKAPAHVERVAEGAKGDEPGTLSFAGKRPAAPKAVAE